MGFSADPSNETPGMHLVDTEPIDLTGLVGVSFTMSWLLASWAKAM